MKVKRGEEAGLLRLAEHPIEFGKEVAALENAFGQGTVSEVVVDHSLRIDDEQVRDIEVKLLRVARHIGTRHLPAIEENGDRDFVLGNVLLHGRNSVRRVDDRN